MLGLLRTIGEYTLDFLSFWGKWFILSFKAMLLLLQRPLRLKRYIYYLSSIGMDGVPVVLVTSTFTGGVIALETYKSFHRFNAESMIGTVVAVAMARELGPVLSAILVAARSGSSMAAEIGTMNVTEQIDALRTMAINPIKYLITPRIYSSIMALPLLTVISDIAGYIGGYAVSIFIFHINSTLYWRYTRDFTDMDDVYHGLIKAAFFGLFISTISCTCGYFTRGGAKGVGESTTKAVVTSAITILIFDYFMTSILRAFNI